jgi:predicted transposase/invertase (TIGR01784 family)
MTMRGENPSPTADLIFRALFGSDRNKALLMSLINSIVEPRHRLVDIVIKNPFNLAGYKGSKESIVDIKAMDQDGTWYGIEMQMHGHIFYGKRAMYYLAKGYVDQLELGQHYSALNTTIGIHFLGFNMFSDDRMVRQYVFKDMETNEHPDQLKFLQLYFVEMGKCPEDWAEIITALHCWVAFLVNGESLSRNSLPAALLAEPAITKAVEELERMGEDPELREVYEAEEKARMADVAELQWAKEQAFEQGIERGLERGIEQGIEQGIERGMQRGQRRFLLHLMARHIGDLPPHIAARVDALGPNRLDELGEALFDLGSYADVESWLDRH